MSIENLERRKFDTLVIGAGGGGFMFFYCPNNTRYEVIKAISSTGAIEYTLSAADEHKKQALAQLQDLPASPEKQAMADIAEFAYSRSY